ncbi:MAG: S-layer homology domain-containing protein [Clostridiales bacterium]|nr:S-layer homology domain-containing protein [Clostridiales bacterium]
MKKFKILSLILAFTMLFGMISFAAEPTEQEIAVVLNQIGLLTGDGNGYNLDGQLTRAEAATFIVKLLGREETVLESPSFYGMTPFTDVSSDEWYAPFVGYCSMNKIISGFPDNTFRANEPLTEKAFLSMVLKSLKYTDADYNWDSVFSTAYGKGVVTDLSYMMRVEDDTLDRGKVLKIMYDSLSLYDKNGTMTLLDGLITNGVVTQTKAQSLGLVKKDATKTTIVSAVATGAKEITVTLNESVASLLTSQVSVIKTSNSQAVAVTGISQNGKTITVQVDTSLAGQTFNLTLLNVKDLESYVTKSLTANVSSFEQPDVTSDYFKIKTVEGVSKNKVNVYFTQPVNINATLVLHYEILKNGQPFVAGTYNDMEAAVMGDVDNGVSLWIKNDVFETGVQYTVKVRGSLVSAYDSNLNNGLDMSADFIGKGSSNSTLGVDDIRAISNDTVRIVFSQDVDRSIATNITNYAFKNISTNSNSAVLSASMSETGEAKNRTVDLRVLNMSSNTSYELKILNARDAFKSSTITNSTYTVEGEIFTSSKVKLEYVQPVSSTKLYFYFDKPIHPASAAANIIGVNDVLALYSPGYNNRLTVYLDKDHPIKEGTSYTIQIASGIIESDGQTQVSTLIYTFQGVTVIEPDLQIADARFVSENKVKIEFSSEVSASNAASQYKLQYKNDAGHDVSITADSINYIDSKTAVLSFSNIPNESYTITAYGIIDPSNQYTTSLITAEVHKE